MINTNRVPHRLDARWDLRQNRTQQDRPRRTTGSTATGTQVSDTANKSAAATPTIVTGNPFSGQNTPTTAPPQPVYAAPSIPLPPPMTHRPGSISLSTTVDSVISNSARSVQLTNNAYNEQAYESYNKAVREWQLNNGRRWVGNQFVQTTMPPPPPDYLPVDFGDIYADISANYQNGRPYEDVNAKRPYYMGGSVFIKA